MRLGELVGSLQQSFGEVTLNEVAAVTHNLCAWQHPNFSGNLRESIKANARVGTLDSVSVSDGQADVITCAVATGKPGIIQWHVHKYGAFLSCAHTLPEWQAWQDDVSGKILSVALAADQAKPRGPYPEYASKDFGGKAYAQQELVTVVQHPAIDPADVVLSAVHSLRAARVTLDAVYAARWYPQLVRHLVDQLGAMIGTIEDAHQTGWPVQPY